MLKDVLTLGALVAAIMFVKQIPVFGVSADVLQELSNCCRAHITTSSTNAGEMTMLLAALQAARSN